MGALWKTVALVRPVESAGVSEFGESWATLTDLFRAAIRDIALADWTIEPGLVWVMAFDKPGFAVRGVFEALNRVKSQIEGHDPSHPLPFLTVFDSVAGDKYTDPFRHQDSPVWEIVDPDRPYVTEKLLSQWRGGPWESDLSSLVVENPEQGVAAVSIPLRAQMKRRLLMPARVLAASGEHPPCYYCGMASHAPADCPSKQMPLSLFGLGEMGRYPPRMINDALARLVAGGVNIGERLAVGCTLSDLRREPDLGVAVAFFDVNRMFQLRFHAHMALISYDNWPGFAPVTAKPLPLDNPLFLVMDCIRVKKYARAKELLHQREAPVKHETAYHAIGQAFLALETVSVPAMLPFLEEALKLAVTDTETVYVHLLTSRCNMLSGRLDAARESADIAYRVGAYLPEGRWAKAKVGAFGAWGSNDLAELRKLCKSDFTYFFIELLDPDLAAVAEDVDRMLGSHYERTFSAALHSINALRRQIEKLGAWLSADDPQVRDLAHRRDDLGVVLRNGGLVDMLSVIDQANPLTVQASKMVSARMAESQQRLQAMAGEAEAVGQFWEVYGHKALYLSYGERLSALVGTMESGLQKAGKQQFESQKEVDDLCELVRQEIAVLVQMQPRMARTAAMFKFSRSFWKSLWAMEILSLFAGGLLLPAMEMLYPVFRLPEITALGFGTRSQAQLVYVLCVFVSPLIALSLGFRKAMKSDDGGKKKKGGKKKSRPGEPLPPPGGPGP